MSQIRRSLYKHAFGTPYKKDQCYESLKISFKPDTLIKGNCTFMAMPWDAAGGSTLSIMPYSQTGRLDPRKPVFLIRGHGGAVLDFEFDPFDDHIIATACEDTRVRVFEIPEHGLDKDVEEPLVTLQGHERKAYIVGYHPTAKNVLYSASQDNTVRLWDVAAGAERLNINAAHTDQIYSVAFDYDGSTLGTTARDLMLRLFDPRSGQVTASVECHESNKPTRVVFLGNKRRVFTTGFNKRGERQFAVWDQANLSAPLHVETLELSPAQLQPFYDDDTGVMFLAGKGEAGIRYYEMIDEAPYNFFLSEYKSTTPQKGLCLLPKRIVDVRTCEIDRFLKLTKDMIEPINFTVPRKSEVFQTDIFPETRSNVPAMTCDEFFTGAHKPPVMLSLKPEGLAALSASSVAASRLSQPGRPSNPGPAPTAASSSSSPTLNTTSTPAYSRPSETRAAAPAPAAQTNEDKIKQLQQENARQAKQINDLEATINTLKKAVADNAAKMEQLAASLH